MQSSTMKASSILGAEYLRELEAEERATRECLQNVPIDKLADWKPHEKSMNLGYLAILVADIPRWIQYAIEKGEVNFATYEQGKAASTQELVEFFERNMQSARTALASLKDVDLKKDFQLKNSDQVLFTSPLDETISSSINHMVHHRGQLSVYLRLNDTPIYGPSADATGF